MTPPLMLLPALVAFLNSNVSGLQSPEALELQSEAHQSPIQSPKLALHLIWGVGPYLSDRLRQDGGMKSLFRIEERTEELVASFGGARLVRSQKGRFELRVGSETDRIEAREWEPFLGR